MTKPAKTIRVALYARVSTTGQDVTNQLRELREAAAHKGWTVEGEYIDQGISGSKTRADRPALDAMLVKVAQGKVDMVAAWAVDRLGRSLQDLLATLQDVHAGKAGLYLHQQGLDTTTTAGRAMFSMMGVFAQFERDMIRERVLSGIARAKADGKVFGAPTVGTKVEDKIREYRAAGHGIIKTAKLAGCGVSVVQRVMKAEAAMA